MDDGHLYYLIFAAILLILGGFFAGTEIALASVSKIRIINHANDGDKRAKKALYIFDNFDKALTTLLIGNNIMHIGCASLMTVFAEKTWGEASVTIVTFITTLFVFFFSEMIPKSFAKACSEKFVLFSSRPLYFLMKVLTPLSFLFTKLSKLIEKPLGIDEEEEEPTVSEEELKDIIENIDETDEIDDGTKDLVQNVIEFTEKKIVDIMTPWDNVITFTAGDSTDKILKKHRENMYSRYPVVSKSGNPIGLLRIQKYLQLTANGAKVPVSSVIEKITIVDEDTEPEDLLRKMSANRIQFVLVRSKKDGKILGAMTQEDLLEEIVGEIMDESDTEETL